jgi:hypothetical protein
VTVRLKPLDQGGDARVWQGLAAGQNIDRRVAVLGPGVNREVTFGDEHDDACPMGVKLVTDDAKDLATGSTRGLEEACFERLRVIEQRGLDAPQIKEHMRRERFRTHA